MDGCLPDHPHPVRSPRSNKRKRSPDNPTASGTSPPKDDAIRNKRGLSPVKTLPSALPDAEKNDRRVEIALEHYNKEKGKNYELGHFLCGNGFSKGSATNHENWFHCNFTAKQPNRKSHRLFFAELHARITPFPPKMETWTVTCCTILKGTANVGCKWCSILVHPTCGFRQGLQKPKFSKVKPGVRDRFYSLGSSPSSSDGLSDFVDEELWAERRGIMKLALEYYNKENDTNYQLAEARDSYEFVRDGWWNHCNFTAKLPYSDTTHKFFAAEALLTDREVRTWTVTACVALDTENNTKYRTGCYWCPKVVHPTQGFLKGYGSE